MALFHRATLTPTKDELIADWAPTRPWGPSVAEPIDVIGSYRFDDPDGRVGMETHLVSAEGGLLQVPLTYRDEPLDGAEDALITEMEHSVLGTRWVYDGLRDPQFVIMARTDAAAVEGLDAAIARARLYREAGADMIFAEALTTLEEYRRFAAAVKIPVLANMTEFGKTPLFTMRELKSAGIRLALYPLSAFRAMNAAALKVYRTLRKDGTQRRAVSQMQTRAELYQLLGYDGLKKGSAK